MSTSRPMATIANTRIASAMMTSRSDSPRRPRTPPNRFAVARAGSFRPPGGVGDDARGAGQPADADPQRPVVLLLDEDQDRVLAAGTVGLHGGDRHPPVGRRRQHVGLLGLHLGGDGVELVLD